MEIKFIKTLTFLFLLIGLTYVSCRKDDEKDPEDVVGCTDTAADNYNAKATKDSGNCVYQNRFASEYEIKVACDQASQLFADASLEIKKAAKNNQVEFFITSSATNIQFYGTIISKDSIVVDTLIPDFQADLVNLVPFATDSKIVTVDLGVKTRLGLSKDIRNLNGQLKLKLISKDTIEYQGLKIPPTTLEDKCEMQTTKK